LALALWTAVHLSPAGAAEDPVARGKYLVRAGLCIACHTDYKNKGAELAGGYAIEVPFGKIYSTNITPDPETGIGGIHLVHELMAGYDALVVVDAVDRDRPPGTVMVIDAEVIDVGELPVDERHDLLADMHLATPERALMVAEAAGVLPERTVIVGCQPAEVDTLGIGLSPEVTRAVDDAVTEVERCVQELALEAERSGSDS